MRAQPTPTHDRSLATMNPVEAPDQALYLAELWEQFTEQPCGPAHWERMFYTAREALMAGDTLTLAQCLGGAQT
jgi:hypothetical protein